jgi:hypothetical protein
MIYVVLITFQVSEKHKLDDSSCDRCPVKVCGLFLPLLYALNV